MTKQIRPQIVENAVVVVNKLIENGDAIIAHTTLISPELGLSVDEFNAIKEALPQHSHFFRVVEGDPEIFDEVDRLSSEEGD